MVDQLYIYIYICVCVYESVHIGAHIVTVISEDSLN